MLRILTYPNEHLVAQNRAVESFDSKLRDLVIDMELVMRRGDGVGLAAPQVGKNIRMFIIEEALLPGGVVCNPSLVPAPESRTYSAREGCLSFPGLILEIPRHTEISVEYQDVDGKIHQVNLDGFAAHVFQHEVDHINGVLMIDHLTF